MANRRNRKIGLIPLLENSRQPIYALDEHRRIAYANHAAAIWLDTSPDQLIGLDCNYHSRPDADRLQRIAASLCPPPEAFVGTPCQSEVGGYLLDGPSAEFHSARPAQFYPLNGESNLFGVLVLVGPTRQAGKHEPDRDSESLGSGGWHRELAQWRREYSAINRIDRVLGSSQAMRSAQRAVNAAIASGADTFIVGPPGGGMEQLARAIHYSQYEAGTAPPLIPLDCTVGDAESLHIALRQVQSDRDRTVKGRLLLLHADRMEIRLMTELTGFTTLPNFDVGLLSIGATSLQSLASQGQFDPALAQHLSTLEIRLPPLRERIEDLPLLCQSLIEDYNAEGNHQFSGIHGDALELLCQYPWPGNLDELGQVIQAACKIASPPKIRMSDLPKQIQHGISASNFPQPSDDAIDLSLFLIQIENELMRRAMRVSKGNKAKAARLLGVSRQRVIRWSEQPKSDEVI